MIKVGPTFSDFVSYKTVSKRRKNGRFYPSGLRLLFPLFLLITTFILLMFKLFYLQIIQGQYYKDLAEGNRIKIQIVRAERGILFDRNKKPLVQNVPLFKIKQGEKYV